MSCQALITLSVGACREAQGALCNLSLPARLKFQAGVGLSRIAVMLVPGSPGATPLSFLDGPPEIL